VTVDGHSRPLPQPFLVIATQNPVEHHGTYPLPESQMDRFMLRVRMTYPEPEGEREILRGQAGAVRLDDLEPVLKAEDILALQEEVRKVQVDESLLDYVLRIVQRTRESEQLALAVSPRGSLMLFHAAQAMAYLEGRAFCKPDDIKRLAIPAFAHRVVLSNRTTLSIKRSEQAEHILRDLIDSVPVPI
jgi:MoxR-like ATPase